MQHKKILPVSPGRYGEFGGTYVPELLMQPVTELTAAWNAVKHDQTFRNL
jgi:tryptophan synthase beta subunit